MSRGSTVHIHADQLRDFARKVLETSGARADVAFQVAEGLVQTSLRGVDSHGIRLLPHYLDALKAGRINGSPDYRFEKTAAAVGRLDGDHTFGHAAGSKGMAEAINLAREAGVGTVSVFNSSHFGAAAYFALQASERGYIGLSFTHADSLTQSYGGTRAYFGTNPICMTVPCKDEEPFCLDMATSLATWNKVLQHREAGQDLLPGWAVDSGGSETLDAEEAVSLQPIGAYKGFGLAMMVEILCGVLGGMPFGRAITRMYKDPIQEKRLLGHFFMAMRLDCFGDADTLKSRMRQLMEEVRAEPAADPQQPVMVPGDPEKKTAAARFRTGIPIPGPLWNRFQQFAATFNIPLRCIDG
jgi:ureidoglycolate dehydrogenase (NAD+)